jgi:hypothetical protein
LVKFVIKRPFTRISLFFINPFKYPLPQLTMDQINAMSKEQAQEYVNTTPAEALEQFKKNSASMVAFVKGLSDEQLDSKGSMPAFGGEVTTEQLIEYVIFQSAVEHFESIKAA